MRESEATHLNALLVGGVGHTASVSVPMPFLEGGDALQVALQTPSAEGRAACGLGYLQTIIDIGGRSARRPAACETAIANELQQLTGRRWKAVWPDWSFKNAAFRPYDVWEVAP
jgi:hypothetical protein